MKEAVTGPTKGSGMRLSVAAFLCSFWQKHHLRKFPLTSIPTSGLSSSLCDYYLNLSPQVDCELHEVRSHVCPICCCLPRACRAVGSQYHSLCACLKAKYGDSKGCSFRLKWWVESIELPLIVLEKVGWKVTGKWEVMKFPHGIFLDGVRNLSLEGISRLGL